MIPPSRWASGSNSGKIFAGCGARGRLIPDVARGRELLALLKNGAVDGLSIGYRTVRGKIEPRSRVRQLYQVDLWEISIVTFPLLQGARVSAVKTMPDVSMRRAQAERAWQQMEFNGAADAPAPLARRGSAAHVSLRSRADRKIALRSVASAQTGIR